MTKHAILFFIIAVFCSLKDPTEWIRLETGSVELSFPGQPRPDSMVVKTELGPVKAYTFIFEDNGVDASNLGYTFAETAYSGKQYKGDKGRLTKRFLSGAVDGAVTNSRGKLISQKDISLQGYPGREVKISMQNGTVIATYRIYRKENQLVTIGTTAKPGREVNTDAEKFFSTFRFKTDNVEVKARS